MAVLNTVKSPISDAVVFVSNANFVLVFSVLGVEGAKPPVEYPCVSEDCPAWSSVATTKSP